MLSDECTVARTLQKSQKRYILHTQAASRIRYQPYIALHDDGILLVCEPIVIHLGDKYAEQPRRPDRAKR